MKITKKLSALLCACAMIFALAACGGGGASVVDTLIAADEKLSAAKSMEGKAVIDMAMVEVFDGEEAEETALNADMTFSLINEPLKLKGDVNLNMEELGGAMNLGLYAVQEGDTLNLYMGMMGYWMSYSVDMSEFEELNQLSGLSGKDLYTENQASAKKLGDETVNGVSASKYTITLTGASMAKMMQDEGIVDAMEQIGDMGADMDIDWEDLYSNLGDLTMTVWIDGNGYPVRYEMDMMNMVNQLMTKMMEQSEELYGEMDSSVTFTKMLITMDLSGFDSVEDFEIPEEVTQEAIPMN